MSDTQQLPPLPSGGNRRRLDALWLEELERWGLSSLLPEPPSAVPPELRTAVDQFNRGEFWECHETLEDVWRATPYPLRFFYHALIKVAVGFHHMSRHNRHGARVKLSDGVRLLRLFQPSFMQVGTEGLLADASEWLARVEEPDRLDWPELDTMPRPAIRIIT